MTFDARTMKQLAQGEHLTSPEHPGLRLEAFKDCRTWTYRYRSPIDDKLRQCKIGQWPLMSVHAAIVAWEGLRDKRASGRDPVLEDKAKKADEKQAAAEKLAEKLETKCTVLDVCESYYAGHLVQARKKKSADMVHRLFETMLGDTALWPAAEVTRSQAFDLIKKYTESAPAQARKLRTELGAAWDYAIDSGRLPETAPNWWRLILRAKIRSKGKMLSGVRVGTAKRTLSQAEVGQLLRWVDNFSELVADAVILYLWTVTRGSEIMGMRGIELVLEGGGVLWWTIPKERTKNARHENATDLRVPLFGRARAIALKRKERYGDGSLFVSTRRGFVKEVGQETIKSAVYYHQPYSKTREKTPRARLPVTHWTPHDLRRTSRTLLASLGCQKEVAESIVGHVLPGVEGIYNQYEYDPERVQWLRRLDEHLELLFLSV